MSELVFAHSRVDPRTLRLRLAAAGFCGSLVLALVGGVLALQTMGVLSSDVRVTAQLPTVGDTLGINSDVKYNGLRVGRVVAVDPGLEADETGWDGPRAEVLVDPEHAELIPSVVRARVLPGTLFGNEYVDLVAAPKDRGAVHLADGDVVPADTSRATLRLMDTFSATQRLLAAVDPAQWDLALSQLADSLDGRGPELARMVRDGDAFLRRWNRDVHPQLRRDLDLLAHDADLFADVEPQLVNAIRDSRPLARTLVAHEEGTTTLLRGFRGLLDGEHGVTAFLRAHGDETARMLDATAATLQAFADRHPAFELLLSKVPALLRNGARAVRNGRIQMEGVLATKFLEEYDGADCPRYRDLPGRCGGGARR